MNQYKIQDNVNNSEFKSNQKEFITQFFNNTLSKTIVRVKYYD